MFHYKNRVSESGAELPFDREPETDAADPAPEREPVDRLRGRPERSLLTIARHAAARNQSIRIRFTLSLLDPKSGQYKGWRGQNWKVPARDIDEARQVSELLELLFDCIDLAGVEWTIEMLAGGKKVLQDAQAEEHTAAERHG
jgi:hypothetical protein